MHCPNCGKKCSNTQTACPSCETVFATSEQLAEMVVLRGNLSEMDANMTVSLLSSYKIPAYKTSHKGAAINIYLGISQYGIDVKVPQSMYEQADEILKAEPIEPLDDNWWENKEPESDAEDNENS